jgi:hypothetical protein
MVVGGRLATIEKITPRKVGCRYSEIAMKLLLLSKEILEAKIWQR